MRLKFAALDERNKETGGAREHVIGSEPRTLSGLSDLRRNVGGFAGESFQKSRRYHSLSWSSRDKQKGTECDLK